MPSLNPGGSSQSLRAERVRIELGGPAARQVVLELSGDESISLATPRDGYALNASGPGRAVLTAGVRGGGQFSGKVTLSLVTIPVATAGTQRGYPTRLDLMGLVVEGRSRVDLLAVECGPDHFWAFRSLLVPRDPEEQAGTGAQRWSAPTSDPTVSTVRHIWGDLPPLTQTMLVAVDRSASVSWAYTVGGCLGEVLSALRVVAAECLMSREFVGLTYGCGPGAIGAARSSLAGPAPGPSLGAADDLVTSLTPEMFASGSDPAAAVAEAERLAVDQLVVVTDRLPAVSEITSTEGLAVSLVLLGAPATPDLWPEQSNRAVTELRAAGVAVHPVAETAQAGQINSHIATSVTKALREQAGEQGE